MAYPINTFTSCPECDEELLLPAIAVDQEGTCWDSELSQLSDLYIMPDGAPDILATFSTTPTYVASSIDNTVTDNSKSKHLVGIGDMPDYTAEEEIYPKGAVKEGVKTYTQNWSFTHLSDGQYEFFLKIQCGNTSGLKIYYGDRADFIYGKQGGIPLSFIKVTFPKGRGETDKNVANVQLRWLAKGDPLRKVNPIA